MHIFVLKNQYRLGYHLFVVLRLQQASVWHPSDRLDQPNLVKYCFMVRPPTKCDRLNRTNRRVFGPAAPATQHVALERPAGPVKLSGPPTKCDRLNQPNCRVFGPAAPATQTGQPWLLLRFQIHHLYSHFGSISGCRSSV